MKIVSALLLVAFVALTWSYGEARECLDCSFITTRYICGRNTKTDNLLTFKNNCDLDRYNCLTRNDYIFDRDGRCPGRSDAESPNSNDSESSPIASGDGH
ncbi:uncharacterized protein LOC108732254 [Agrilus planipennis]|uniref:Uncharacterized protein LOC108732254 n=1 Tax=Agrilus planipennis TaxID=224129 RepID=A0A1W4WEB1_AGRPL|nr:uncharacterized protein LOC108732254 [Agrilus planipennis]